MRGTPVAASYVCLLEIRLHLGQVGDLKSKRKLVTSLKAGLRQRFGASVAEVDGHDKWQRATLVCALVGDGEVRALADEAQRFVESRHAEGCAFERKLFSLADLDLL